MNHCLPIVRVCSQNIITGTFLLLLHQRIPAKFSHSWRRAVTHLQARQSHEEYGSPSGKKGLHFAKDRIVHRGRNRGCAALDTHSCRIIACMPSAYRRSIFNARLVAFLLIRWLLRSSKISILFYFLYLTIKFPIHRPQISSFFYKTKHLLQSLLTRYSILFETKSVFKFLPNFS